MAPQKPDRAGTPALWSCTRFDTLNVGSSEAGTGFSERQLDSASRPYALSCRRKSNRCAASLKADGTPQAAVAKASPCRLFEFFSSDVSNSLR